MPAKKTCKKCLADQKRKAYAVTGSFFVRNVRLSDGQLAGYWVHHYYDDRGKPHSHSTGEKGVPAIVAHVRLTEQEVDALREAQKRAPRNSVLASALGKTVATARVAA